MKSQTTNQMAKVLGKANELFQWAFDGDHASVRLQCSIRPPHGWEKGVQGEYYLSFPVPKEFMIDGEYPKQANGYGFYGAQFTSEKLEEVDSLVTWLCGLKKTVQVSFLTKR